MGIALLVASCLAFDIRGGQGQGSSDRTERVMTKNHIRRKEKGSSGLKRNKKKRKASNFLYPRTTCIALSLS